MHSCDECAVLKQAVSSFFDVQLSNLEKNGQRENPCPLLAILHQVVMLYKGKWGTINENPSVHIWILFRITKDGVLEGDITMSFEAWSMRIAMVEFFVLPGSFPPWLAPGKSSAGDSVPERSKEPSALVSHARTSTRMSLEPESEEFSNMISTWVKDCQDDHSACKSSISRDSLPMRFIDVGSLDGRTEPRLCDANRELGDYIALSHCWGGKQPLKTTKENIPSMKICIPFDQLPSTFQDAIQMTRRLGVRYIWIDSLCIVQDDGEDWESEAAKMALIFEGAYLTIAATAASNSSDGLFPRERAREFVMDGTGIESHIFMREKRSEDCFLPRKLNTGLLSMDTVVDYRVDELYPLQNRAWCFQELLLSPRVLHFTHSEVLWHCRTKWDCECEAVRLGGSHVRKLNASMQNPAVYEEEDEFAQSVQWPEINAADPSHSWHDIVSVFTSKQITYREDILPALSGTAKKFGQLRDGRYVAGLWEDNLAHDLSWHVPITDTSSRPRSYLGPSFSWCSCISRIEWPNWTHDYTARLEILDVSSTIDGMDPTGKVSGAFIKVRGAMTRAHLIFETEPRNLSMVNLTSEDSTNDRDPDATLETSADAFDLTPGDPRTWTDCLVLRDKETLAGDWKRLAAGQCRLDTVDDVCYASSCCEKKSTYDPRRDGSWKGLDPTHMEDLCTDKNLIYCLMILESPKDSDKRKVALMLVPSFNAGSKTFKRIGIVYNMTEELFRDAQEQELTIV